MNPRGEFLGNWLNGFSAVDVVSKISQKAHFHFFKTHNCTFESVTFDGNEIYHTPKDLEHILKEAAGLYLLVDGEISPKIFKKMWSPEISVIINKMFKTHTLHIKNNIKTISHGVRITSE